MTHDQAVLSWKEGAQRNLNIARDMMNMSHFDWALFLGQLALEKLLKGLYLSKTDEIAPFTHDLVKLARICKVELTQEQTQDLIEITRFHVQARYEEVKYELYKKATKSYADEWMGKIKEFAVWIQKHY